MTHPELSVVFGESTPGSLFVFLPVRPVDIPVQFDSLVLLFARFDHILDGFELPEQFNTSLVIAFNIISQFDLPVDFAAKSRTDVDRIELVPEVLVGYSLRALGRDLNAIFVLLPDFDEWLRGLTGFREVNRLTVLPRQIHAHLKWWEFCHLTEQFLMSAFWAK